MPNIIAGRRIMPELLQSEVTPDNIARQSIALLTDQAVRKQAMADLTEVREKLGETGAVNRVAQVIMEVAQNGYV